MRRKSTAILPLYIAGIILLVFAVFPHHHHDSFICFNTTHCPSADTGSETPHHHPESSENGHCIQYLFQTDQLKTLSRNLCQGNNGTSAPFTFFCFTLPECLSVSFPDKTPRLLSEIRNDRLHQLLFSSHKTTRGPPQWS